MTTIYAGQHIYANVEKEQSPHRYGGLQTLFYTRAALNESETEAIEAYVPYWRSEEEAAKWVFFTTSTGKSVVARIVPLTGADRQGREGRYLAHSLVFAPEEFARIGADPFWVLQHFHFFTTIGQSARELRAIEKMLNKRPDIPEPFRRAVTEATAALPSPQGWRGFLHALLASHHSREENDDEPAR